jgi:DNA recombination protein RmuC
VADHFGSWVAGIVGLGFGAALAWLIARSRGRAELARAAMLTAQTATAIQVELAGAKERASRVPGLEESLAAATRSIADWREQAARLNAELTAERETFQEKLGLLADTRQTLSDQFKNLANEILEDKSKRFTEQNQANLGALLDPLKLRIAEFQSKIEDTYVKEGRERTALGEQVRQLMELNQQLSGDAKNLTRALRGSSKAQGNWGELVLERVLEASGLRKGEEYLVQASYTREDGTRALPDVVIRLPEGRNLVVDAKVSLVAYEEFAIAEVELDREAASKRHIDSVKNHIRGLSEKNYHTLYGLKSIDFVLLFVPIEPAFMLAVTSDRDLFMDAWRRNVLLVSPSTLLFVVRTVAHLWRQEAQTRNAQEIAKRGAELYDKFVGFVEDMTALGNRLRQAQSEYEGAFGKLTGGRGHLIGQAEKLRALGIKPSKSLPTAMQEAALEDLAAEGARPGAEP